MYQTIDTKPDHRESQTIPSHNALETPQARVQRLYTAPGGALMGWLFDEAACRGHQHQELAQQLGVTVGYLYQLRSGVRQTRNISHEFAKACASYLGVPPVVIKLVSGQIHMSDFATPQLSEEELVERAFLRLMTDPIVMPALPQQLETLNYEARRALVLLYSEVSCQNLFALHDIPESVRWLKRAALLHDEAEARAAEGHQCIDIETVRQDV